MSTVGRRFTITAKGDKFCDVLFALAKPLLKRGLIFEERNCSLFEYISFP